MRLRYFLLTLRKFLKLPYPFVSVKKNFWGFHFRYVSINCPMLPCKTLGYTRTNILCMYGTHQMCICKRAVKLLLHLPNSKVTAFGVVAASLRKPFLLFSFLLFLFYSLFFCLYFTLVFTFFLLVCLYLGVHYIHDV